MKMQKQKRVDIAPEDKSSAKNPTKATVIQFAGSNQI
jgi:hypothetical protein